MRFLPFILLVFGLLLDTLSSTYANEWDGLSSHEWGKFVRKIHPAASPPPEPTEEEFSAMEAYQRSGAYSEFFQRLSKAFPNRTDLWALAFTDRDQDAVMDWKIFDDEDCLIPRDLDLDNDGVENIWDPAPFDPTVTDADEDGDGIPDHLDWNSEGTIWGRNLSLAGKAWLQSNLFRRTGVLMIFDPKDLEAEQIFDLSKTIQFVFQSINKGQRGLPGFRYLTVAMESQFVDWVGAYSADEQMILINGDLPLRERKGYFTYALTHEIGHIVASMLDPTAVAQFTGLLWHNDFFTGGASPREKTRTYSQWVATYNTEKNLRIDAATTLRRHHIVSHQSLFSPAEYVAESFVAYVYGIQAELEARLRVKAFKEKCPPSPLNFLKKDCSDTPQNIRIQVLSGALDATLGVYVDHIHPAATQMFEDFLHLKARSGL